MCHIGIKGLQSTQILASAVPIPEPEHSEIGMGTVNGPGKSHRATKKFGSAK